MCLFSYSNYELICLFFFQAEDGIRDLVRSRGLGDVYKRQGLWNRALSEVEILSLYNGCTLSIIENPIDQSVNAVSYTHLTLPTSDLV